MINKAILTPKNDCVDEINNLLIKKFLGEVTRYYSFDETIDRIKQGLQEDFLNSLTPNGLPPHELMLNQIPLSYCLETLISLTDYAMEHN